MANDNLHRQTLVTLLGLAADASDEAISNAAQTFQADMVAFRDSMEEKVSNAESKVAAAEAAATDAKAAADKIANEANAMAEELVNYDLTKYANVIANADAVKEQLLSNRAATVALLSNLKSPTAQKTPPAAPLHDPKTAGQPGGVIANANNQPTEEQAKRISNRARELSKTLGVSHQQAWTMASGEEAKRNAQAEK